MALAQMAELLLRCAAELRCLEGDTLHCWVTRQDLATHLEELGGEKRSFFRKFECKIGRILMFENILGSVDSIHIFVSNYAPIMFFFCDAKKL